MLRIRSDLLFLNRSFLDQYAAAETQPRGDAAVFRQRVLISWLFTLNPFTVERMPLHFSDWFHFGLTEDVRRIWVAPPIALADAMHYRTHPHAAGSNTAERLFNTRLAVEQHILFHCFKDDLPDLSLSHHNDQSSAERALDILVDNFAVCDLERAGCLFEKYSHEFTDHSKQSHCITAEDWLAMAQARHVRHRETLAHKILSAKDDDAFQQALPFPRTYKASRLRTAQSRLLGNEIVAASDKGVLFFGPYATLPAGHYTAAVTTTTFEGSGTLILRVTAESGDQKLAEKEFVVAPGALPTLEIDFDVQGPRASRLEVVCDYNDVREIAVSELTITERPTPVLSAPAPAIAPLPAPPKRLWRSLDRRA